MTAITNQPDNLNYLSQLKFSFLIKKLPNVNFFVQQATLPNVTLGRFDRPSPFVKLPEPGDHLEYGEFQLTFRVDEDMRNFREMYNWMLALGFPENFSQYKALADKDVLKNWGASGEDSLMSDGTLIIQNSNVNSNLQVTFHNMFPTSVQDLIFDYRQSDVEYLECLCTFAYERFSITSI